MKICMFTNTYAPHVGGVARSVATFEEAMRGRGHDVLTVAPEFEDATESTKDVVRVPAIRNFNGSDFSMRIPLPGVISLRLEEFAPDVIHAHHPFLLGDAALRAARDLGLPIVYTHHTLYEQYTHYVPLDSKPMKEFVIRLCTEFANMCQAVIAPSQSIAELIRERGVKVPIVPIATGIDLVFFGSGDGQAQRDELGIPADATVIGHLGRLAPEKNLDYLSRAVAKAVDELPGAVFLVVGSGPSTDNIEQIFRDAGLQDRLYLPGSRSGQALADSYAAMDLFAFASKSETQGMVLAEAMAAGKAVVALDAAGSREVVEDGVNGRLLPGDAEVADFTRALLDLLQDEQQLASAEAAAKETAHHFSVPTCTRRLERVYTEYVTAFRLAHTAEPFTTWDSLLAGMQTEWELLVQKSSAIAAATGLPQKQNQQTPR